MSRLALNLLGRLVPGLETPSGIRLATLNELSGLLPFSHPILSTRERPVEARGLLLHVGVGLRPYRYGCLMPHVLGATNPAMDSGGPYHAAQQ